MFSNYVSNQVKTVAQFTMEQSKKSKWYHLILVASIILAIAISQLGLIIDIVAGSSSEMLQEFTDRQAIGLMVSLMSGFTLYLVIISLGSLLTTSTVEEKAIISWKACSPISPHPRCCMAR